ncbi:MAG: MBL fold metallo-hydrolase [Paracoccaceae bacterium]|jgi:glyoxylase-like metal-dependent hydrolase (beta-lactamase superfamily II)
MPVEISPAPPGVAEWLRPGKDGGLRRVLAPNPSPMTGRGTNSYLVGTGAVAVIDPGPDDTGHLAAILAALDPGERISHIFVTHAHRDHSALAPRLAAATGAPVLAFGDAAAGRSPLMEDLARREPPTGGEGADRMFQPNILVADRDCVSHGDWSLTALHTPGHFGNHLCFSWQGEVFSGDHVMGWSTSIVAPPDGDMGAYMRSLDRLAAARPVRLWPGHGDPVPAPLHRIADLTLHRQARARAIVEALRSGPATPFDLARQIYTDTPAALMGAAALNVFAHLIELSEKNEASADGDLRFSACFRLT